jgi:hypothetical protein
LPGQRGQDVGAPRRCQRQRAPIECRGLRVAVGEAVHARGFDQQIDVVAVARHEFVETRQRLRPVAPLGSGACLGAQARGRNRGRNRGRRRGCDLGDPGGLGELGELPSSSQCVEPGQREQAGRQQRTRARRLHQAALPVRAVLQRTASRAGARSR